MNSQNATDQGYAAVIGSCWACHDSDGNITSGHPDRYKTPKTCPECHLGTGTQNSSAYNATIVSEHYYGGIDIKAGNSTSNISSCINCHENVSEMIIPNNDNDTGSFAGDGQRLTGGNMSYYHYGNPRPDLRFGNSDNCSYCHQNTSTEFTRAMVDSGYNSSIQNHSMRESSSNPDCTSSQCHNTGWIHNSTLTRPSFSLPNSTYCISCHTTKQRHNGSTGLNCTQCHIYSTSIDTIHPIKYMQTTGLFLTSNTSAVNCTNCHQNSTFWPGAPIIPDQIKHSNNRMNGSLWNNTVYWNSESDSCYYCHTNTKHNSTALGKISTLLSYVNSTKNGLLTTTTYCADCHYDGSANSAKYKGNQWIPNPPTITVNNTKKSGWIDHSGYLATGYNDSICFGCHGGVMAGYSEDALNFTHRVSEGGGGGNCISCHDIGGSGAPLNKRIKARAVKLGVHRNLNTGASNATDVDPINKACWACHGEGIEPSGHPARYKNPRECSNNDCHALSQEFKAPMVYSHFKDAQLNDNPSNALNYNVSTRGLCEDCHYNSLVEPAEPMSNSSVSHYASRDKLIESVNCIYCHLDEDNAKDWGNATEINKNRTGMIQINRENEKFTARTGEIVDLGTGYRIKVTGISQDRGNAAIEIYKVDTLVDSGLVGIGEYIYEENLVIDNSTVKTPVIVLNITDMFISANGSFIQFNGSRIKRLHPENRTTSCILCHYKGTAEKHKYEVIDRKDDDVYYTEVIFNSSDKELYDQEKFQKLLATLTPLDKYLDIQRPLRTALKQGVSWDMGKDYKLTLKEVATDGKTAIFNLEIGNRTYTDIVRKGEQLEYNLSINYLENTYTEVTIFNATVKEIAQANPNIVILEDVKALSPEIMSIKDNTTLYGYNTSWFWVDDTFMTGRIPQNLHVPLLFDGKVGGPDCISCHGTKDLGKHAALNGKASSTSENIACWICHGDGNEPKTHPATYNRPRVCKSCHADRVEPYYNATYIGDENHKNVADCSICHVVDTHKIIRFDVMPGIKEISVSKYEIYPGEKITLKTTAIAGFNMKLKAVEYYIDSPENKLTLVPVDGSFDGQREDVTAQVNTAGLKAGEHMIYVRAMERDDKWGPESSISFTVKQKEINISEIVTEEKKSDGMLYGTPGAILSIIIGYSIRKYLMKR